MNLLTLAATFFRGFSHRRADIALAICICVVAPLFAVALREYFR